MQSSSSSFKYHSNRRRRNSRSRAVVAEDEWLKVGIPVEAQSLKPEHVKVWWRAFVEKVRGNFVDIMYLDFCEDENPKILEREVVHRHLVQPFPPLRRKAVYELGDRVEVLDLMGWWIGQIVEINDQRPGFYGVYFLNHHEIEQHPASNIRLSQKFVDGSWHLQNKDPLNDFCKMKIKRNQSKRFPSNSAERKFPSTSYCQEGFIQNYTGYNRRFQGATRNLPRRQNRNETPDSESASGESENYVSDPDSTGFIQNYTGYNRRYYDATRNLPTRQNRSQTPNSKSRESENYESDPDFTGFNQNRSGNKRRLSEATGNLSTRQKRRKQTPENKSGSGESENDESLI